MKSNKPNVIIIGDDNVHAANIDNLLKANKFNSEIVPVEHLDNEFLMSHSKKVGLTDDISMAFSKEEFDKDPYIESVLQDMKNRLNSGDFEIDHIPIWGEESVEQYPICARQAGKSFRTDPVWREEVIKRTAMLTRQTGKNSGRHPLSLNSVAKAMKELHAEDTDLNPSDPILSNILLNPGSYYVRRMLPDTPMSHDETIWRFTVDKDGKCGTEIIRSSGEAIELGVHDV